MLAPKLKRAEVQDNIFYLFIFAPVFLKIGAKYHAGAQAEERRGANGRRPTHPPAGVCVVKYV